MITLKPTQTLITALLHSFKQIRNNRYAVALLFISLFISVSIQAKKNPEKTRKAKKADNYFAFSQYNKALPMYLKFLEKYPDNVQFNYKAGVCYLYSNVETMKAKDYLEKSKTLMLASKDTLPDLFYYLGHYYHITNRFEEAIQCFKTFKSVFRSAENLENIDFEIEQCENGLQFMQKPVNATLTNLSKNVNSIYPDYSPALPMDESMIVFTSKRKDCTGGKLTPDGNYYEDIFIATNVSNEWAETKKLDTGFVKPKFWAALFSPSQSIGNHINTNEHDASIAISSDGKKLYLYRFNDIWTSDFVDGKWQKPKTLGSTIDGKKSHESSLCLTPDEKIMYFVSEREGGFGGKDIYRAHKLDNGSWGRIENLGSAINTEADEEAPFWDALNNTLYFSSQSHGSMGGFDVFKSRLENTFWATPENLGYPINSGGDDIFYILNAKQNNAYVSAIREDGIGNFDIYKVNFNKPVRILLASNYGNRLIADNLPVSVAADKGENPITIPAYEGTEINYNSAEKYTLKVPGYKNSAAHTFEFTAPDAKTDVGYYQEISYEEVKNPKGQVIGYKTSLYNAFFDIEKELKEKKVDYDPKNKQKAFANYLREIRFEHEGLKESSFIDFLDTSNLANQDYVFKTILFDFSKSNLRPETLADLDNIIKYLKDHPEIKMEVVGHTDSKGSDFHNNMLSRKRALAIADYFIVEGIDPKRLRSKGMGEKFPLAPNENPDKTDNPEGRQQNRRVEFVIIKK